MMAGYMLRPGIADSHRPVVYVPGVGGRTSFTARWQQLEQPIAAAVWTTPGRAASVGERASELAAVLREQTGGDVLLVGHSLGALIAFEASIRSPERIRTLVVLAQYPPHVMRRYSQEDLERLSVLADLEAAVPSELAQAPGFLDAMRDLWRYDYKAAEDYQSSARTEVPIVAIGATEDKLSCDPLLLAEWARCGRTRVRVVTVPGSHNFVEGLTGEEFMQLIREFAS